MSSTAGPSSGVADWPAATVAGPGDATNEARPRRTCIDPATEAHAKPTLVRREMLSRVTAQELTSPPTNPALHRESQQMELTIDADAPDEQEQSLLADSDAELKSSAELDSVAELDSGESIEEEVDLTAATPPAIPEMPQISPIPSSIRRFCRGRRS